MWGLYSIEIKPLSTVSCSECKGGLFGRGTSSKLKGEGKYVWSTL
jgi:hypothetical protein